MDLTAMFLFLGRNMDAAEADIVIDDQSDSEDDYVRMVDLEWWVSNRMVRRSRNQINMPLPEKTIRIPSPALSDEEKHLYRCIQSKARYECSKIFSSDIDFNYMFFYEWLLRLRQAASHPALVILGILKKVKKAMMKYAKKARDRGAALRVVAEEVATPVEGEAEQAVDTAETDKAREEELAADAEKRS
eukprot:6972632-Prymnesium_polylepis.3